MYDVSIQVTAKAIEPNRRIVIEWPGYNGPTTVEWTFAPLNDRTTFWVTCSHGEDVGSHHMPAPRANHLTCDRLPWILPRFNPRQVPQTPTTAHRQPSFRPRRDVLACAASRSLDDRLDHHLKRRAQRRFTVHRFLPPTARVDLFLWRG